MSYAQRTTVGQPATFNEIERTLKRYGATAFMYGATETEAVYGKQLAAGEHDGVPGGMSIFQVLGVIDAALEALAGR